MSSYLVHILCGLLLQFLQCSTGQIPILGKCPVKSASSPIDIRKLSGQWFEAEASLLLVEWPYKCVSIKVAAFFEKKAQITVEGVHRYKSTLDTIRNVTATIATDTDGKDGKLHIINEEPTDYKKYDNFTMQVLDTDYDNWALIWLCRGHKKVRNAHTELMWILSRQRKIDAEVYKQVRKAVEAHHLETIRTRGTIQWKCSGNKKKSAVTKKGAK